MKRVFLLSLLTILLLQTPVFSGTTGKIMGQIIDSESGEPLVGVNVIIQGTTLGASTDANGQFIIINISPGVYSVKASMMGYKAVLTKNVRVKLDLTTNLNVEMVPTAVQGESVIVTAQREIIQKDLTSSQSIVGSEEIEDMPIEEFEQAVKLKAGVVEGSGGEMHIRGGRSSEIAFMVDGISVTDPYNNSMGVEIENNAIQELQVVSGTFNAEYGQAMSGIINIVTKEGNYQNYSGNLSVYFGEYYTEDTDIFYKGDQFDINNINDIQGSVSGPLPFLKDKASFFLSGRYNRDNGYYNGKRLYNPDSYVMDSTHTEWYLDTTNLGDGKVVPMNPSEQISLQGKLGFRVTPDIKLTLSGQGSKTQSQGYSHYYFYNPDGRPHYYSNNFNGIVNLNHTLSSRSYYSLKYSFTQNESKSYTYENPTDSTKYNTDPLVFNEFSGYQFLLSGMYMGHNYRTSTIQTLKGDITSQITRNHLIKSGFEFKLNTIDRLSYNVQVNKNTDWEPTIPKYDPDNPGTEIYKNSINYDESIDEPWEMAFYIQDKMEFKDMIVNLGFRYEYFNSNGRILTDPRDPNPYSPMYPSHIFHDEDGDGVQDPDEPEMTDDERLDFWFEDSEPKTQLSPRLGISYPITDRGVIHFSYGHFLQMPPMMYMFANPDNEVTPGYSATMGNANLEPQRTVQYEIGLQQQISANFDFDVTGFYKDIRNLTSTEVVETYVAGTFYGQYVNYDFGNSKGITFSLTKRRSNYLSATLDYTFSLAEGNASDPTQRFWDAAAGAQPQKQLIFLDWDQRHTLNGTVSFSDPDNWGVTFLGSYGSGLPYTPSNVGGNPETFKNSGRKPPQYELDMQAFKKFNRENYSLSFMLKVYNIFDRRNMRYVFSRTGSAAYNIREEDVEVPDRYDIRPDYYTAPRLIKLGMRIEFK
ncbi:MAG: TonB-dependent receptor [Candidatus Marinimicrobia bacterium]|nr:TonB-dependent receptor [Candidatus Neomarinimicrobiota bacterium]